MYIDFLSYSRNRDQRLADLKEIFFLSAKRSFSTDDEKRSFFDTWVRPYIEHWPDDVLFVCELGTHKTLGYLTGCRESARATPILSQKMKSFPLFTEHFKKYPAHLHMNCHPNHRGHGAGTFLLLEYLIELRKKAVKGVHIVTSAEEPNVAFYRRHGFTFTDERRFNESHLLFMGRKV